MVNMPRRDAWWLRVGGAATLPVFRLRFGLTYDSEDQVVILIA
jgi:hypothetical protein